MSRLDKEVKKIREAATSVEARQWVENIDDLCEKCYSAGLFSKPYPTESVLDYLKQVVAEFDWASSQREKRSY